MFSYYSHLYFLQVGAVFRVLVLSSATVRALRLAAASREAFSQEHEHKGRTKCVGVRVRVRARVRVRPPHKSMSTRGGPSEP